MAATGYFVRSRGKISGPFDVGALQRLIKRGQLSRVDELSQDRTSWIAASQFDELFPARLGGNESAVSTATAVAAAQTSTTPSGSAFYYVQDGATVGPVPVSVLQALAQNGTLGADDLVWPEGAQSAVPAAQLPALIPSFSGPLARSSLAATARPLSESERGHCLRVLQATDTLALASGIVSGFILLLFLNLPMGSNNGVTRWWWDVLKQPGNGTLVVLLFFVLFAGLLIGIMGAATRGIVRAWAFIGLSGLSFLLFLVIGLTSAETDGGYFFSLIIPYLASALIGLSVFRRRAGDFMLGKIFQGVVGGVMLLALLIVGILILVQSPWVRLRPSPSEQLPSWLVLALTAGGLGLMAGITSGILALVLLKRRFSQAVNTCCAVAAAASVLLPSIALVVGFSGSVQSLELENKGLLIFMCFRCLVIFLALIFVLGVGMVELFTVSYFKPLVRNA